MHTINVVNSMLLYIDVGSGAMVLQWIIAGAIGCVIYFRRGISALVAFFFKRGDKQGDDHKDVDNQ